MADFCSYLHPKRLKVESRLDLRFSSPAVNLLHLILSIKWKTKEARREPLGDTKQKSLSELRAFDGVTKVKNGKLKGLYTYKPELPTPPQEKRRPRVSFAAEKEEIAALRDYFEDEELSNSEVGRLAFDEALYEAGYAK